MIEVLGNLWDYPAEAYVITTNGTVRGDGHAVMGRGCALEAKKYAPGIDKWLGERITASGNHVYCYTRGNFRILTMPVKHDWREPADMLLIEESAYDLKTIARALGLSKVVMPRPGCGNGKLNWEDVRSLLEDIELDDRFHVITFGKNL